ncbi:MAG: nucleotidyltransferase domain-containing protein [Bacteroidetes bacterium]|nr:nucleotidyltransferase domain-containing protein [Bacteroidota bacterium]
MLQQDALNIARQYVANLNKAGIVIYKAYLFGSYARNQARESSDIDILLVSDAFDTDDDLILSEPWSPKYRNDYRIEPVAIGKKRFQTEDYSMVLEVVRQEGIEIN